MAATLCCKHPGSHPRLVRDISPSRLGNVPGIPQEELEPAAGDREIWANLLSLLPTPNGKSGKKMNNEWILCIFHTWVQSTPQESFNWVIFFFLTTQTLLLNPTLLKLASSSDLIFFCFYRGYTHHRLAGTGRLWYNDEKKKIHNLKTWNKFCSDGLECRIGLLSWYVALRWRGMYLLKRIFCLTVSWTNITYLKYQQELSFPESSAKQHTTNPIKGAEPAWCSRCFQVSVWPWLFGVCFSKNASMEYDSFQKILCSEHRPFGMCGL